VLHKVGEGAWPQRVSGLLGETKPSATYEEAGVCCAVGQPGLVFSWSRQPSLRSGGYRVQLFSQSSSGEWLDKAAQSAYWRSSWASAESFQGGAKSTFCLSFSGSWRCNANRRTQNASPFLHHKENAQCYGNSCIATVFPL